MTNDDLDRARRSAPIEDLTLEQLLQRRDRKEGRQRIGALITALVIAAGVIFGLVSLKTNDRIGAGNGSDATTGSVPPAFSSPTGLSVPDGSYVYTRTAFYSYSGGGVSPLVETWWATDNSGRINDSGPERMFGSSGTYAAGQFPNDTGDLSGLSTDATTLEQQMIDRTGPGGASPEPYQEFTPGPGQDGHLTAGMVRAIGELLRDPNASPDLRAALFRVLVDQQGMNIEQSSADPAGRPAIELWIQTENEIHRFWFDAGTQQVMAFEDADLQGVVYGRTIIEKSGVVDSTQSTDPAHPLLPSTNDTPLSPTPMPSLHPMPSPAG